LKAGNTSGIILFVQDCFGCLGLFCFHVNFRIDFSISLKNDL
jgi:hypothetical protein